MDKIIPLRLTLNSQIQYPIYYLRCETKEVYEEDKIMYDESGKVLDNKNLKGTLATRRLRISNLARISGTIMSLAQLLKRKDRLLLLNDGTLAKYKATKFRPLIYRKIRRYKPINEKGYLMFVHDIPQPIFISAAIFNFEPYVGVIKVHNGYLLYELADYKKQDTRRKV